jgi:hypothetical protein
MESFSYIEVLSGLHKGGQFKPRNNQWSIGAGPDNSIMLLDEGLPERLIEISLNDQGQATVEEAYDEVLRGLMIEDSLSEKVLESLFSSTILKNRECFYFGEISFRIILAAPIKPENTKEISLSEQFNIENRSRAKEFSNLIKDNNLKKPGFFEKLFPNSLIAKKILRNKKLSLFLGTLLISILMLNLFSTNTLTIEAQANPSNPDGASVPPPYQPSTASGAPYTNAFDKILEKQPNNFLDTSTSLKKATRENYGLAAKEALESALANTKLDNKLDVQYGAQSLQITGRLNKKDRTTFERLLKDVIADYGSEVKFLAKIKSYEEDITMQVQQVMGGANPMVILTDGTKLFVGSTYKNLVVKSITTDKVTLQGHDTHEVII